MRSSSGEHFVALDHVRAVAALMVFTWHFIHARPDVPVPFEYVPWVFPLALLDEGHTGVSLFMTLSGYLFAKLLSGKTVRYPAFVLNRVLRLAPLLLVVFALAALQAAIEGTSLAGYARALFMGLLWPTWPNGGWSITVEFHFYIVLPVLLWLARRNAAWLWVVLLAALVMRSLLYTWQGGVQHYAYWTIVGRIDQFLLGLIAFRHRGLLARRHVLAVGVMTAWTLFFWDFDRRGGFYLMPSYPSPSGIWVVLPTIEGLGWAAAVAYYDATFTPSTRGVSGFIGRMGAYSYSIYLLHFFVVFRAASLVNEHIMTISNFYLACAWAFLCYLCMAPLGYLSFRFVEAPFLAWRRPYASPRG